MNKMNTINKPTETALACTGEPKCWVDGPNQHCKIALNADCGGPYCESALVCAIPCQPSCIPTCNNRSTVRYSDQTVQQTPWTPQDNNRVLTHTIPKQVLQRTVSEGHFQDIKEAAKAGQEWLKYVALCRAHQSTPIGMISSKVDEIWHAYILFTREYFDFSISVLGLNYFHHAPNVRSTSGEQSMPDEAGPNFVRLYTETFGPLPKVWGLRKGNLSVCGGPVVTSVCTSCTSCTSCGQNSCGNCASSCNSGTASSIKTGSRASCKSGCGSSCSPGSGCGHGGCY